MSVDIENLKGKLNEAALYAAADCADNEGVWAPGYVGGYWSGRTDAFGDAHIILTQELKSVDEMLAVASDTERQREIFPKHEDTNTYDAGYVAGLADIKVMIEEAISA